MGKLRKPSPALVVGLVALFVALSGTAVAAGIVPLAKRALTADNAKHALVADQSKKLTAAASSAIVQQASQAPSPASTAASLVTYKSATWTNGPQQEQNFTVSCDAGEKAIGGGWTDPGDWSSSYQSFPTPDGSAWTRNIYTSSLAPSQQSGTIVAVCLK